VFLIIYLFHIFLSSLYHFIFYQLGEFSNPDGETLEFGQIFRLDLDDAKEDNTRVKLPHPEIIEASEIGHNLLIDDGKVKFTVVNKGPSYLECRVDVAGRVKDRKGVNTPDSVLAISPLTPKDRSDLEYMVRKYKCDNPQI
jgi:pyruvate kinase